jgi:predicted short-subunit dehydrogenase-like oxidoreductase (DUF2520 family)
MNTNKQSNHFCVIGCGRLGIALSVFLSGQEGFTASAFCSKSSASAQKAADVSGTGQVYPHPCEAVKTADIVFITTPDTIIEPVCNQIAEHGGFGPNHIVFHLSGALSSDILASARHHGAAIGSIHPLQAFAPYEKGQPSQFKDINMSIEGDERAVILGKKIVKALSAMAFTIPTEAKTLYHASAVVASNYLVTLEHFALELLKQADLSEAAAYDILEPLIMGTLKNIKSRGSVDALTGPVARGDNEIVERHMRDIDKQLPRFSNLYRIMGKHTLDIAVRQTSGSLSDQAKSALIRLFETDPER